MIYEIDSNIYRIEVPLAGSPLGVLNAYYFRGPEEEFLMDTGFNTAACEASLRKSLNSLGARLDRLNIINTHLHVDHTGLDHWFVGENRRIYLSAKDCEGVLRHYKREGYKRGDRDRREGADDSLFAAMLKAGPEADNARRMQFDDEKYVGLSDRAVIDTGVCQLRMILVPGHTPGNAMFYIPDKKIMFTGDHVLFDITNLFLITQQEKHITVFVCCKRNSSESFNHHVRYLNMFQSISRKLHSYQISSS